MAYYRPIDVQTEPQDPTVLRALTGAQAHRIRAVPLSMRDDTLLVAADEPAELLERALELLTGQQIELRAATSDAIDQALARLYPEPIFPETTEQ